MEIRGQPWDCRRLGENDATTWVAGIEADFDERKMACARFAGAGRGDRDRTREVAPSADERSADGMNGRGVRLTTRRLGKVARGSPDRA